MLIIKWNPTVSKLWMLGQMYCIKHSLSPVKSVINSIWKLLLTNFLPIEERKTDRRRDLGGLPPCTNFFWAWQKSSYCCLHRCSQDQDIQHSNTEQGRVHEAPTFSWGSCWSRERKVSFKQVAPGKLNMMQKMSIYPQVDGHCKSDCMSYEKITQENIKLGRDGKEEGGSGRI